MDLAAVLALAISNGEVILIIVLIAAPIAAIAFVAGAGRAFDQVGKGGLGLEFESDASQGLRDSGAGVNPGKADEEELRQLLEAKAYRQRARGEQPLDVEAEFDRLIEESSKPAVVDGDAALREEVRQLVLARNERRLRQGQEPLDVETEVTRQLREFENLGQ